MLFNTISADAAQLNRAEFLFPAKLNACLSIPSLNIAPMLFFISSTRYGFAYKAAFLKTSLWAGISDTITGQPTDIASNGGKPKPS